MTKQSGSFVRLLTILSVAALLTWPYLTGRSNYLLFHSLAETFSIVICCGIFMIAWNARRFIDNNYFLFIGTAYLFVAILDLLHTFSYKGAGILPSNDADVPTLLWIAARYLQAVSLLIAPFFLGRKLRHNVVLAVYGAVTGLLLAAIFLRDVFPPAYLEGAGVTRFELASEYSIALILLISAALLFIKKEEFDQQVLLLLAWSIIISIASELAFAFSLQRDDAVGISGHIFKLISFYLIYKALIETGLVKPYKLLFNNLKRSEERLREERDRAQNYLDVARALIVIVNADQRVSLINRKGCELLGFDEDEVLGRNWFDAFVPARMREELRGVFSKLMTGEILPVEYYENPVVTKSGEEKIVAWHNAVLVDPDGRISSTLSSGEDITGRRRAEEQLARKTAELERSNAELEQFASVVSHELKEPLLSIGGFAELLREKYHDKLDNRAGGFLTYIFDGTLRMERLINDLLTYARVTTRGRTFEPVDCSVVLVQALSNLRMAVEASSAVITADELPEVMGDETQFIQLFQNLVGNAIKYRGDAPPRIHVSAKPIVACGPGNAECAPQSRGERQYPEIPSGWLFSVSDNGIGIEPRYFERIFQIFERLHTGDKYSGTGIGLAVCKKIVERHGGRIWVESEPGQGSIIFFTIPERCE